MTSWFSVGLKHYCVCVSVCVCVCVSACLHMWEKEGGSWEILYETMGVLVKFCADPKWYCVCMALCVCEYVPACVRDGMVVMIWCEVWIPSNRESHSTVSTALAACRDTHTELSLTHTENYNTSTHTKWFGLQHIYLWWLGCYFFKQKEILLNTKFLKNRILVNWKKKTFKLKLWIQVFWVIQCNVSLNRIYSCPFYKTKPVE